MVVTMPVCCCALLTCESLIHVNIVPFFVYNSCVAPMFSLEWNKALDLP